MYSLVSTELRMTINAKTNMKTVGGHIRLASIPRQRRREQLAQSKMEEITSAIARVFHLSGWTTFSMPKVEQ
ncbi:hypothetical protein PsorP6_005802 [Peronosclerospora sorghi]|uniref:Uncharacterized protein n=1 Tax=Peronosclerospora sorghi TaxID=230839 RepID=A0ACC0W607_9STRA|nr:hypothetical protein PsorP6_005802 [Peronosclerospora sorghi]